MSCRRCDQALPLGNPWEGFCSPRHQREGRQQLEALARARPGCRRCYRGAVFFRWREGGGRIRLPALVLEHRHVAPCGCLAGQQLTLDTPYKRWGMMRDYAPSGLVEFGPDGGRGPRLITERLILRRWRASDAEALAVLNADPQVVAFLPGPLSRVESDALLGRLEQHFDKHGFGLWAVELPGQVPLIGWVGLLVPRFEAAFTPCVEIGWRFAPAYWGKGYATEGAHAALQFGFEQLGLKEIVSFTVPANGRSRRVMERLGMEQDEAGSFEHPLMPEGHALRPHLLYRLSQARWQAQGHTRSCV
ncbi:MAG: GNAT family N-acetyltransferase [Myxococcota bacterium]